MKVSRAFIQHLESGKAPISLFNAIRLANCFSQPTDRFIKLWLQDLFDAHNITEETRKKVLR
jgi:hypothetical protein